MENGYFQSLSDEQLSELCLSQLEYMKVNKRRSNNYERNSPFFADLQSEIVNRFISEHTTIEPYDDCDDDIQIIEDIE